MEIRLKFQAMDNVAACFFHNLGYSQSTQPMLTSF